MANKPFTKGVKRHRKWLKHLYREDKSIVYREGRKDDYGNPMMSAYISFAGGKEARFVPPRMAQNLYFMKRDK